MARQVGINHFRDHVLQCNGRSPIQFLLCLSGITEQHVDFGGT